MEYESETIIKRSYWEDEHINIKAEIKFHGFTEILTFNIPAYKEINFATLKGTFTGIRNNGNKVVVNLDKAVAMVILENNYQEVLNQFKEKKKERNGS